MVVLPALEKKTSGCMKGMSKTQSTEPLYTIVETKKKHTNTKTKTKEKKKSEF
jgi:hypothetical protein